MYQISLIIVFVICTYFIQDASTSTDKTPRFTGHHSYKQCNKKCSFSLNGLELEIEVLSNVYDEKKDTSLINFEVNKQKQSLNITEFLAFSGRKADIHLLDVNFDGLQDFAIRLSEIGSSFRKYAYYIYNKKNKSYDFIGVYPEFRLMHKLRQLETIEEDEHASTITKQYQVESSAPYIKENNKKIKLFK